MGIELLDKYEKNSDVAERKHSETNFYSIFELALLFSMLIGVASFVIGIGFYVYGEILKSVNDTYIIEMNHTVLSFVIGICFLAMFSLLIGFKIMLGQKDESNSES